MMILNACVHELPWPAGTTPTGGGGGTTPPATASCSPDTVYFQNTVLPLLNSSCAMSGCHDAASHKDGVNLTTYAAIMSTSGVNAGKPGSSKLYQVIADNSMPPKPAAPFTQAQKDIISKWISQGAKNNVCNGCDTATFTFSGAVSPMMNTYCKGCHNPAALGGGVDLSTYAGIKASALTGKLLGSIQHAAGVSAMPKGGAMLSACQITQVQKWISAGTLNN
jgi:Planctomycete cytochrome C